MATCPACGEEAGSFESSISDQLSGREKAFICANPSCTVLHFKAADLTLE